MAQRRMFSNRITNSARFIKMPLSSQALYFHLGLHADDDGVVEAFSIMRQTGAVEDDLRILVAKGFVSVLNDDLVTYITDWNENNKIRADRKVDSIYKDLLLKIMPTAELKQPKPRADTGKVTGHPLDNQWTAQVRLGKVRLGKDSKPLSSKPDPVPYGEIISYLNEVTGKSFKNVETHKKLIRARWNEKATLSDFKRVIDNKSSEWLGTDMAKYLQPSTLFGSKFDQYLNQTNAAKQKGGSYAGVEF
ncbi:conserved phage C-terminal domain-containing protein [Latilactobacillus curvatus]|uniref:conserved phage C-terminal domain-containing protein n=1 Tax=Latilactobacillus curvatus TaxID=28038 RepID=UPI002073FA9F|nr:conserved phage C-terminal domain-containing protein [Latilactobacillus curvatus]MCM6843386.1 conserved phage C-terminal domain-containing protein [Latilactobacillus curvatus]MCM6861762.1 conserved phage C-terminal domain-containing protein [Latilactobacillus curvatus]MCM6869029.1 conserved phage C-terminal domain-containing protein [Latilactobacillus curvatus]